MPDQASGVTPVTTTCQPSARFPGAPSGNGWASEPGPERGPGVGEGAVAGAEVVPPGSVTGGSGVGVGCGAILGRAYGIAADAGVGLATLVAAGMTSGAV